MFSLLLLTPSRQKQVISQNKKHREKKNVNSTGDQLNTLRCFLNLKYSSCYRKIKIKIFSKINKQNNVHHGLLFHINPNNNKHYYTLMRFLNYSFQPLKMAVHTWPPKNRFVV